jgi:hypothetical protein
MQVIKLRIKVKRLRAEMRHVQPVRGMTEK